MFWAFVRWGARPRIKTCSCRRCLEINLKRPFALDISGLEEDAKGVEDISTSQFLQHEAEVYAVASFKNIETNNKVVLSGGGDDNAYLWFPDDNNKSIKLQSHTDTVSSVAFNNDGKLAATGSMDATVKIWSVEEPSRQAV